MTAKLATIFISIKFLAGCAIGMVSVAVIYRSRLAIALLIRGTLFAGVAFLIVSACVGRAGSHAAFLNGHRLDVSPRGEDLWLRNRIAENEGVLCTSSSVFAALLAGLRIRGRRVLH